MLTSDGFGVLKSIFPVLFRSIVPLNVYTVVPVLFLVVIDRLSGMQLVLQLVKEFVSKITVFEDMFKSNFAVANFF